jgi:signal transduction histidine kinase
MNLYSDNQERIAMLQLVIQQLVTKKEALEQLVLQERDFWAKVVHEARCHVRGILLGLDMLYQMEGDPETDALCKRALYTLKESMLKYKTLLYNLTDYSTTNYGRNLQVKTNIVSINEYLQATIGEFSYCLSGSGNTIDVQYAAANFKTVVDTLKFGQVVHNLLINACQHGAEGVIQVRVEVDPLENEWRMFISNPIEESERSEGNSHGNLGLGLVICRQLIELMNGQIITKIEGGLYTAMILMPI